MADRGIQFSAAMVRALLEGRKSQTRRLATFVTSAADGVWHAGRWNIHRSFGGVCNASEDDVRSLAPDFAPHQPGDRLYVREHWKVDACYDAVAPRDLLTLGTDEPLSGWDHALCYLATAPAESLRDPVWGRHRQAMHMPRWASRLTLLVTEVRVQRLQDISSDDALAEGVDPKAHVLASFTGEWNGQGECVRSDEVRTYVPAYAALWDSLHTAPGTRWEDNPWVYCVTFDVRHGNIDRRPQ